MSKGTLNKIVAKLERLNEYLNHLKEIQKVNKKSFLNDYHFYGLAERYFQLSIEALMDIGKLIIIAENLEKPEENEEIIIRLGNAKILPKRLIEKLSGLSGFRNILVHDYEKINHEIVYEKLQKNLKDFTDFKKTIAKFLEKKL